MEANSLDKIHIMIDIETFDTKPSAVILSIGAFVIDALNDGNPAFYVSLDPTQQPFRSVSENTKKWWREQPIPIPVGPYGLYAALSELSFFINSFGATPIIWCKGTDFDVAILAHAYEQMNIAIPWKYNNIRDCRTLFKVTRTEPQKAAHNALIDARQQAQDLLTCLINHGLELA